MSDLLERECVELRRDLALEPCLVALIRVLARPVAIAAMALASGLTSRARVFGIASAALPGATPEPKTMDDFLFEIDLGVPHDALFLAELGLSREEMMGALRAGITSRDVFDAMDDEALRRLLSPDIADRIRPR